MKLPVLSALLFLCGNSWWNQLRGQARRLKQPKYAVGALLAAAYVYLLFLRPVLMAPASARLPAGGAPPRGPTAMAVVELLAALGLTVLLLTNWLVPKKRAALDFSEAEIAFLFPAPVSRRALIHWRLLRSQGGLLFAAVVLGLLSWRHGGAARDWMLIASWWLLINTLHLHHLGASFARTWLADRGVRPWRRRAALAVAAMAAGLWYWWLRANLPPLDQEAWANRDLAPLGDYLVQVAAAPPVWWLLAPARLLLGPLLAQHAADFALALPPAAALLGLHYWWVMRSQVAFEEAALERARHLAALRAVARSGNWHLALGDRPRAAPPFDLRPRGPRLLALLWKNLIAGSTILTLRFWVIAGIGAVAIAVIGRSVAQGSNALLLAGALTVMLAPVMLMMGPQVFRLDFRQDLSAADVLKTYPLPGWQVVLGEILAPLVLLTGSEWLLLALGVAIFPEPLHRPIPYANRLPIGLGLALLVPGLCAVSLLILNGFFLLFPAWVRSGPSASHGFEQLGRDLLFALGQVLGLVLALLAPAAVFGLVYWAGHFWMSWRVLALAGAGAAAAVLTAEVVVGIALLGTCFEQMDISAEQLA